jgi:hypothetical protein
MPKPVRTSQFKRDFKRRILAGAGAAASADVRRRTGTPGDLL